MRPDAPEGAGFECFFGLIPIFGLVPETSGIALRAVKARTSLRRCERPLPGRFSRSLSKCALKRCAAASGDMRERFYQGECEEPLRRGACAISRLP